jgi:hypothetical protein
VRPRCRLPDNVAMKVFLCTTSVAEETSENLLTGFSEQLPSFRCLKNPVDVSDASKRGKEDGKRGTSCSLARHSGAAGRRGGLYRAGPRSPHTLACVCGSGLDTIRVVGRVLHSRRDHVGDNLHWDACSVGSIPEAVFQRFGWSFQN